MSERTVIVGAGQLRNKPGVDGPFAPREPARMAATCLERAAATAGRPSLVHEADAVAWIPSVGWPTEAPVARLAQLLGRPEPKTALEIAAGGDGPTTALCTVANRIAEGEIRIALLAGAEVLHSLRRAAAEGVRLDWPPRRPDYLNVLGERPYASDIERRHHVHGPIHMYPLLENAIRARKGRTIPEHQRYMARLLERFSEVAERNPISWFAGERRTAAEIVRVDARNRWICFPYPKLMNAIIEVDQAAALIVMAEREADRLGIARERRVHFLGGGLAEDGWSAAERFDLASSPAYEAAAAAATGHAGCSVDDVDCFDLYSCFPAAVELAMDALGLELEDPRGFTCTGGLAHHGGPGNDYAMHALANTAERIVAGRARVGWVSGQGVCATKHSICVLSNDPERVAAADGCASRAALPPERLDGPPLAERPEGPARVESYTVSFDRRNEPRRAIYVLRLPDGRRTFAIAEGEAARFERILCEEAVGRSGRVRPGAGEAPNRFELAGGPGTGAGGGVP